ncbi:MAG TPA: hypothetical protein VLI04_13665 [Nocardioidaceae bacterium]|nr:hypothetical protein [Nocardioidaceae bacterium]
MRNRALMFLRRRKCSWAVSPGSQPRNEEWYECGGAYASGKVTDYLVIEIAKHLSGIERLPLCPRHAEFVAVHLVNRGGDQLIKNWDERRLWRLDRHKQRLADKREAERKEEAARMRERKAAEKARQDEIAAARAEEDRLLRANSQTREAIARAEARERRLPFESSGFVYYVLSTRNGRIKIGTTARPETLWGRVADAAMKSGGPVRLLALHHGYMAAERGVHLRWKHIRNGKSEWFNPDPELLTHIDAINTAQRSRNSGMSRAEHFLAEYGVAEVTA